MNRMKNAPLRGLALAFGLLAAMPCALAQSVGGNASLSVSAGTARVAFPASPAAYPFALLAPAQGSAQEMFYKLGDVTVTAATTGAALPPAGLCIAIGPNTNVAAITASGSATLRVTQLSQCPPTGFGGGNSGGSFTATQPTGTTTQAKVTISVTNTYQQALASSATRKGCTIQYVAVAGTKGFVFIGSAPADTTTSFQLTNGQSINCEAPGVTLTDAVQVTATGTDIFIVSNQ